MEKFIICSVLPDGLARINAWAPGSLERNFDRMRTQYPTYLPVAALLTDPTLFKVTVKLRAMPVTVPIGTAARLFRHAPVGAAAVREVAQQVRQLDTNVAAELYGQWRTALAASPRMERAS